MVVNGVQLSGTVIREDQDLPSYGMIEPSFHNKGTQKVIIDNFSVIEPGKKDFITTGGLPLTNDTLSIRFEGTGAKELHVTFGKPSPYDCNKI